MTAPLRLRINGEPVEVFVEAGETLDFLLRERLDLTGTKVGCESGACGACTVLIDGRPSLACTTLALDLDGAHVETIEGLRSENGLHPLQEAFVRRGAVQCGFCTPGMIMSALALLRARPNPTRDEIRQALAGNLCRCTGYVKIVDAVEAAARECAGE